MTTRDSTQPNYRLDTLKIDSNNKKNDKHNKDDNDNANK